MTPQSATPPVAARARPWWIDDAADAPAPDAALLPGAQTGAQAELDRLTAEINALPRRSERATLLRRRAYRLRHVLLRAELGGCVPSQGDTP